MRHHATTHITVSAMQMTLIMLMNAWMLLLLLLQLRRLLLRLLLLLMMMLQLLLLLLLQIVVEVHKAGLRANHLCCRQGEEICNEGK